MLRSLAEAGVCYVNTGPVAGVKLVIENGAHEAVLRCERQGFATRARVEVFEGDSSQFSCTAASLINIGAGYDVRDTTTSELIGIVARQATRSLVWDSWVIYAGDGTLLARVREESAWKYFLRRLFLGPLLPMSHGVISPEGLSIALISELVGLLERRHKLEVIDQNGQIDFRLLLTMAILLALVQSKAEDISRTRFLPR